MAIDSVFEKSKYEKIWGSPFYRAISPGLEIVDLFFEFFEKQLSTGQRITDYGCGTGLVAERFAKKELSTHLIDITERAVDPHVLDNQRVTFEEASLWELSTTPQSEWAYCCDVLEHLPPQYIDQVLQIIRERTTQGGYFQIHLDEEPFNQLIDEPLHLTIRPQEWWEEKLQALWDKTCIVPLKEGIRFGCLVGV